MEAFAKSTALAASMLVFVSVGAALSQNAPPGNPTNTGFMAQQPNDRLASRLVGLNIQNTGDENIGEIHDIVLTDAGAVKAFVVSGWISRHGHALCGDRSQSRDPDAPGRKDLESHHECK
jgi:PRC-barrel domain